MSRATEGKRFRECVPWKRERERQKERESRKCQLEAYDISSINSGLISLEVRALLNHCRTRSYSLSSEASKEVEQYPRRHLETVAQFFLSRARWYQSLLLYPCDWSVGRPTSFWTRVFYSFNRINQMSASSRSPSSITIISSRQSPVPIEWKIERRFGGDVDRHPIDTFSVLGEKK